MKGSNYFEIMLALYNLLSKFPEFDSTRGVEMKGGPQCFLSLPIIIPRYGCYSSSSCKSKAWILIRRDHVEGMSYNEGLNTRNTLMSHSLSQGDTRRIAKDISYTKI